MLDKWPKVMSKLPYMRDDHLLDLVVRRRAAVEDLHAVEGGLATRGLVGEHAADGAPEDLGRPAEVELAALGVCKVLLAEEPAQGRGRWRGKWREQDEVVRIKVRRHPQEMCSFVTCTEVPTLCTAADPQTSDVAIAVVGVSSPFRA